MVLLKVNIMPEISSFYGIVISMYPSDHNPPHFHVRYNDYRAIIEIESEIVTGEMPNRALKFVFEWLGLHRDEMMDNWNKLQNGIAVVKIKPLE